jgi:PAT family beta-lactamase induction signal transducer AmpG
MDSKYGNDTWQTRAICYTGFVFTFILAKLIMIEIKKQSFSETFSIYFDQRMLKILLLGAISGFPWVLIGSSLSLWLKEDGLSRSTVGWAGLIFAVYAFNYLWAPLVDRIQIPYLTKKIGHRRGWIVLMQLLILISLGLWSLINPTENLALVISVGLLIAIASATQDITVDALRIEQIGENEGKSMAAGAAMAVVGWWSGYKLGGVIALFSADYLQNFGFENYWQLTFLILGVLVILMNIGLMFVTEKNSDERINKQFLNDKIISDKLGNNNFFSKFAVWIGGTISGPIISFFKKNGFSIALGILGFVFLFKVGEAFLGRMSIIFYKEIGFSKSDIAIYSKTLGWITTVVFTLLGGLFVIRSGVLKAMFLAGIVMAATNILFSILAWSDKSELLFAIAVIFDDIAAAFATVAFVAFISLLVDRAYTATQYALLASIGTAGRTTLASSSGALVDWLNGNWGLFFILTALMVIPSLLILWSMKNKLKLSEE